MVAIQGLHIFGRENIRNKAMATVESKFIGLQTSEIE
jgi:hypothetical protein